MDVFLTGGTGLVGSHVIQLLVAKRHNVRAMVRGPAGKSLVESLGAETVFGSVEQPQAWLHARGSDAIVHAAGIITKRRNWEHFHTTNVAGARLAAETAADQGVRLVHLSSVAVYGRRLQVGDCKLNELSDWPRLSRGEFYAVSKRGAEEAVNAVARNKKLSAVSLRPCVIYGERDRTFLPHVVRMLKHGISPLVGTGDNTLALVYAGSVAEAVLAALDHPEVRGPVNLANEQGITQRQFFATVGAALGKRIRFVKVPVTFAYAFAVSLYGFRYALSPRHYAGFGATAIRYLSNDNPYDSSRAREELGWEPTIPHDVAIERSVHWFQTNRE